MVRQFIVVRRSLPKYRTGERLNNSHSTDLEVKINVNQLVVQNSLESPPEQLYLLVVSVPVLSEQIAVAFPIVSHASKCRTRLLSFIIFYEIETLKYITRL
jgi:hypothetical protein